MKCIIQYKEKNEVLTCFCGKMKECNRCNNGGFRKDNTCSKPIGGYCTCRTCGYAVRV